MTPTEKLQVVDVPFIPDDKCKQQFASSDRITPDMICAGGSVSQLINDFCGLYCSSALPCSCCVDWYI